MPKKSIRFYNDREVRAVWDEEHSKWWFSAVDIVRAINNEEDYVVDTWEWFDLSPLGAVHTISFSLSSTKSDSYGMLTPAYFCIDNFNGAAPTPPTPPQDEPPYIVAPVEDMVFENYPETIAINLDGVASDPDDPDENIVYTIVSNSNPNELEAQMSGKMLHLTRSTDHYGEADLVIRATSDGQYVDFHVHVIGVVRGLCACLHR